MALYFFHLQNGYDTLADLEGTELPDEDAARDHGRNVVFDLMKSRERRTQHWRLSVQGSDHVTRFDIPFAELDPSLGHLPTELRRSIQQTCGKLASLGDVMADVKMTIAQVRATMAQVEKVPYLAAYDGRAISTK